MNSEIGVRDSYTFEISFLGDCVAGHHYNPDHLEEIGRHLCHAVYAKSSQSWWILQMLGIMPDEDPLPVSMPSPNPSPNPSPGEPVPPSRTKKKTVRAKKKSSKKAKDWTEATSTGQQKDKSCKTDRKSLRLKAPKSIAEQKAIIEFLAAERSKCGSDSGGSDSDPEMDELPEGEALVHELQSPKSPVLIPRRSTTPAELAEQAVLMYSGPRPTGLDLRRPAPKPLITTEVQPPMQQPLQVVSEQRTPAPVKCTSQHTWHKMSHLALPRPRSIRAGAGMRLPHKERMRGQGQGPLTRSQSQGSNQDFGSNRGKPISLAQSKLRQRGLGRGSTASCTARGSTAAAGAARSGWPSTANPSVVLPHPSRGGEGGGATFNLTEAKRGAQRGCTPSKPLQIPELTARDRLMEGLNRTSELVVQGPCRPWSKDTASPCISPFFTASLSKNPLSLYDSPCVSPDLSPADPESPLSGGRPMSSPPLSRQGSMIYQ